MPTLSAVHENMRAARASVGGGAAALKYEWCVFAREVEACLATHPSVQEVAVIGVPSERWGEAVKAVVVLEPEQAADADALMTFCGERLAGYKRPRSVDFVTDLPRNANGKVLKRVLREPYWEGHARRVS